MENEKKYNDSQLIDEQTLSQMAVAYSATLKALENSGNQKVSALQETTEALLAQILAELREIKTIIILNKRVRLGF